MLGGAGWYPAHRLSIGAAGQGPASVGLPPAFLALMPDKMFKWFQRKIPGYRRNPIRPGGACNWRATPNAPIRSITFNVCSPISRKSTAIAGDGSLTGGMAYEALNNLGVSGQRVVI